MLQHCGYPSWSIATATTLSPTPKQSSSLGNYELGPMDTRNQCEHAISNLMCLNMLKDARQSINNCVKIGKNYWTGKPHPVR